MDVVVTKWCGGHQEDHPVSEFGRDKHRPDGLNWRCKAYLRGLPTDRDADHRRQAKYRASGRGREIQARWRSANPEASREKTKRWRESHPEHVYTATMHERLSNPSRVSARKKVHYAVKTGKLVRPAVCGRCGSQNSKPQAHHDDYSRPLDVRWLCARCHKLIHLEASSWTA